MYVHGTYMFMNVPYMYEHGTETYVHLHSQCYGTGFTAFLYRQCSYRDIHAKNGYARWGHVQCQVMYIHGTYVYVQCTDMYIRCT